MDIVKTPIESRKDFLKAFSVSDTDKDLLKQQYKALKKEFKKTKPAVGIVLIS